jgi:hypothetical protein
VGSLVIAVKPGQWLGTKGCRYCQSHNAFFFLDSKCRILADSHYFTGLQSTEQSPEKNPRD